MSEDKLYISNIYLGVF